MRPQLAVCALYPHFSRCVKTTDVASIFRIFFTSLARVFGFLPYAFVNPSLDMWQLLFLIFSRPNSSHIHSESSLVLGVKAFLTEVSVKLAVAFFSVYILTLVSYGLGRLRTSFSISRKCCCFWSKCWSFGKNIKMAGSLLLPLEAVTSVGETS
jgi:hypothetical protein